MNEKDKEKIKNLPTKQSYQKHIKNNALNTYSGTITNQTGPITSNEKQTRIKYDQLLEGKITDEQLREQIIKHSDQLLRERTSMSILLSGPNKDNKTVEGALKIIGIGPNEEELIRTYFMNKYISSNEFNPTLEDFKGYMNKMTKNVTEVIPVFAPGERFTVQRIDYVMEFQ